MSDPGAFNVQTVVHLVRPFGDPVADLEDLHAAVAGAPPEVLLQHTLQVHLRDPGATELPVDDLSAWVGGVLQDLETAEKISYGIQSGNASPERARDAVLAVLDTIPPRERMARRAPLEGVLQLLQAESVTVPVGEACDGDALVSALTSADPGVWFYHVLEQPWLGRGTHPLAEWLAAHREARLADWVREAAVPEQPLERARERLCKRWKRSRLARRIADAGATPEDDRRRAGREVVARLVKRVTSSDDES